MNVQPKFHKYFYFIPSPRVSVLTNRTKSMFWRMFVFSDSVRSEPNRRATEPGLGVVCVCVSCAQCDFYWKISPVFDQIENRIFVQCGGGGYFYRPTAILWHIFFSLVLHFLLFVSQWNWASGRCTAGRFHKRTHQSNQNPFYLSKMIFFLLLFAMQRCEYWK